MGELDCAFCRIVNGDLASSQVHGSPNVLAFMDIDPVNPGHVVVASRAHVPTLADLSDAVGAEMFSVARRVAAALYRSSLRCEGVNLLCADGEAAFQHVFHTHLNVVPRFVGDGFTIDAPWGSDPSREQLDDIAHQLRFEADW
jgi:histidine triad (HIT) family protein